MDIYYAILTVYLTAQSALLYVLFRNTMKDTEYELDRLRNLSSDSLSKTTALAEQVEQSINNFSDEFSLRIAEHDKLVETQKKLIENQAIIEKHLAMRKAF